MLTLGQSCRHLSYLLSRKTHMNTPERPESATDRLARGLFSPEDLPRIPLALTVKVVAGALGLTEGAVYDQVRQGTFPLQALRIGERLIRFRRDDLLHLLLPAAA